MMETEQGLVLTPHGRWQVVQGLARPVPRYEGDPDTRPISQQEVVWLVRLLHQASQHLNTRHGDLIQRYYHQPTLLGQAARLLLAPPTHFVTTNKSISGGPATARAAPAPAAPTRDSSLLSRTGQFHSEKTST